jgi:hypothetical protein
MEEIEVESLIRAQKFEADELSRQAAYSQSMGLAINISHAQ